MMSHKFAKVLLKKKGKQDEKKKVSQYTKIKIRERSFLFFISTDFRISYIVESFLIRKKNFRKWKSLIFLCRVLLRI